jgi:hypothetical protein
MATVQVMAPSVVHEGRCGECQDWTTVGWYVWERSSSTLCDPCVQQEISEDPFSSLIVRATPAPVTCTGGCRTYCKRCWD